MKAILYTEYGSPDVLQLKEVEKPTPRDDDVLVKVYAASVNAYDWHYLRGTPFLFRLSAGFPKPKNPRLGADIAGRVEAVGRSITQFKPGDAVYGSVSSTGNGGFAEYVCAHENKLVMKPDTMTFEQAAAIPMAALTALQALRDYGQIQAGHKVLIYGASGGVGTFAVQIAKSFGAEVTAACSTSKMEMVRSLGADHVIDYTQEDFAKSGQRYDLILAANGNNSVLHYRRALSPNGTYVVSGGTMSQLFQVIILGGLISKLGNRKFLSFTEAPNRKDYQFMNELFEAGKVVPLVDRCYPLSETAEAMRYLDEGHARGKIVITVAHSSP